MKFDDALPDEMPLIYDAWARSFKKSPYAGCVPNFLWDQVSRAGMQDIINRGARVLVAYQDTEAGRRVMGYSVSEPGRCVLHWLFVKRDYRGMGVGRALLRETCPDPLAGPWVYTYRTRASAGFLGSHWEWDPVPSRVKAAGPA